MPAIPESTRARYALAALVALAAFLALGLEVTRFGEPAPLVAFEGALVDRSTLIAWWITWACYAYFLAPLGAVLAILAWRLPAWRARILLSIALLLLCWRGAAFFQHVFARPRRLDWVVKRETSYSYPSSHAAISFGFYLLWAAMLAPRYRWVAAGLVTLVLAVCWSRLSLGAHYATDLLGGALLAIALVSSALALLPIKVFGSTQGRP